MDYNNIDYSKLVSPIVISGFLEGFQAEDDSFFEKYPNFDVNDEENVRNLIRTERSASDYAEKNNRNRFYFNSFCYFLTKDAIDFGEFFDQSSYLPFCKPENPKQFFIWMFEELFPEASWKMDSAEEFTITTNHLIFWIASSDDPIAYIHDPEFQDRISSFNFESKFSFKK